MPENASEVCKATKAIVKNNDVIVENLKVKEMTKTGRGTVENAGTLVQLQALEPIAARRVAPDDPGHARAKGAVVRVPDRRHR